MLYLTRKIGESVIINDDIEVTVVDIRGKSIKLGFTFPAEASVLRREIHERIQAENRAAAAGSEALAKALEQGQGAPGAAPEAADPPAAEPPRSAGKG
jgi:carbon storage regulator